MADADFERLLYQQQSESLLKYVYFLLAAAGAGIGFIVQKLENQHFDAAGSLCLAGAAMWLLSMVLGCLAIESDVKLKHSNLEIIQFHRGSHASRPSEQQKHVGLETRSAWYSADSKKAEAYLRWQKITLLLGIAAVIAWRVAEMLP